MLYCTGYVSAQCNYGIKASDTSICENGIVRFSLQPAPKNLSSITWDFGIKVIKNDSTPSLSYQKAGSYDVKLALKFNDGSTCSLKKAGYIQVKGKPDVGKIMTKNKIICSRDDSVIFYNTSKNTKYWTWVIESKTYKNTGNQIAHKFKKSGPVQIQMVLQSENNCITSHVFDSVAFVKLKPQLTLAADSASICSGNSLKLSPKFSSSDTTKPVITWYFPHSNTDSQTTFTPTRVRYADSGRYDISASVRYANTGCVYSFKWPNFVSVYHVAPLKISDRNLYGTNCKGNKVSVKLLNKNLDAANITWSHQHGDSLLINNLSADSMIATATKNGDYKLYVSYKYPQCLLTDSLEFTAQKPVINTSIIKGDKCYCQLPQQLNIAAKVGADNGLRKINWQLSDNKSQLLRMVDSIGFTYKLHKAGKYTLLLEAEDSLGCKATDKYEFSAKPFVAHFSPDNKVSCPGKDINIKLDDSICFNKITDIKWFVYDEKGQLTDQSNTLNYTFSPPSNGKYRVVAIAQNDAGCTDTFGVDSFLNIKPLNLISIDKQPIIYCVGDTIAVPYQNSNKGAALQIWAKAYNTTDSFSAQVDYANQKLFFDITKAGKYDVLLKYKTGDCRDSITVQKHLKIGGITASYAFDTLFPCYPFTGLLKAKIEENKAYDVNKSNKPDYHWASAQNGVYFAQPDSATTSITVNTKSNISIELQIKNQQGCVATSQINGLYQYDLQARFTAPDTFCSSVNLQPANYSIGQIDSMQWLLKGPGMNAVSHSKTPLFPLDTLGQYDLHLKVWNDKNCSDSVHKRLFVIPFSAAFNVDTTVKCSPAFYAFEAVAVNADSFIWNFGDSSSLVHTAQSETYKVYDLSRQKSPKNTFDISFIAKNKYGCADTIFKPHLIMVNSPFLDFKIGNNFGCEPLAVSFKNKSKNAAKIYFDYGDNSSLDSVGFSSHHYHVKNNKEFQIFRPSVIGKDNNGCTIIKGLEDSIVVYAKPRAFFTCNKNDSCEPLQITLTDSSRYAYRWQWQVGQNSTATDTLRQVDFTLNAGKYRPRLVVANKLNCNDTMYLDRDLTVFELPKPDFSLDDSLTCTNRKVTFSDLSTATAAINSREWFKSNDSAFAKFAMPADKVLVFAKEGTYSFMLKVVDAHGCTQSITKSKVLEIMKNLPVDSPKLHFISMINDSMLLASWKPANAFAFNKYRLYNEATGVLLGSSYLLTDTMMQLNLKPCKPPYCIKMQLIDKCEHTWSAKTHCAVHLSVDSNNTDFSLLNWTPYIGWDSLQRYHLYRNYNQQNKLIARLSNNNLSYIDSAICNGDYGYYIEAVKGLETRNSLSNSVAHEVAYNYKLDPLKLQLATVESNGVQLRWAQGRLRNTTNYFINRKALSRPDVFQTIARPGDTTSFLDAHAFTQREAYAYTVQAHDFCGNTTASSNIATSIFLSSSIENGNFCLHWNKYENWEADVLNYRIEKRTESGRFEKLAEVEPWATQFTDTTAFLNNSEQATEYRVIAIEKIVGSHQQDSSYSNTIKLLPVPTFFVPTAFSPNNDGINDLFEVKGAGILWQDSITTFNVNALRIYNRWGQLVFESQDVGKVWDGTTNGKTCAEGNYAVVLFLRGKNQEILSYKGTLQLIR